MKSIGLFAATWVVSASAAEVTVSSLAELQNALANAKAGDVVRLAKGSEIRSRTRSSSCRKK